MAAPRQVERPLSPHLQIYRFTITMAMSIIHRITGFGLYAGTALLAWWLIAVASGPEAYAVFTGVAGSWIGQIVLFGFTWALLHHLLSGIRYLFWDAILAFDLKTADLISWAALIGGLVLTVAVWVAAYVMRGAL
ncbi:MAG: succinate dehydrogenase, cytochrome b556 subunit [Parvibaculum sp.]|uniref:succinate dehydrogenase, cytochrome b556 subunit n=1 Tax=Parvibaculum sp. TaxID=2024848 RepID=UPI0025F31305|nr:succinate dehydrogenase, cytochrome b556 subunit [Parvibaculum sp.]MCE9648386.1 succinate dehydrogenase, cytochrome b556 subunit [Parvibaculum sp.]